LNQEVDCLGRPGFPLRRPAARDHESPLQTGAGRRQLSCFEHIEQITSYCSDADCFIQEVMPMVDRRRFLSSGVALGAAAAFNRQLFAKVDAAPRNLPSSALYSSDEDSYWAEIRKQFLIPEDEVFLNNATVGSSPAPVLRAVFDAYNEIEKLAPEDPEDYPMWGYGSRPFNQFRDPMAAFVGCSRDEIALVRSATEGINYFANGVDMKPGDEVLITDQEHEHGEQPWQLKARRYGIAVKKVRLPKPAEDAAQVLNLFNDAITSRTRVMFFSHITTETGVVLPVKELCGLAHAKGILSAVDGAQVMGMMRVNVRDLGCDVYCASGHKWLQGPKGTGFFYVRDEVIDRLWNTLACEGWNDPKLRAQRFQQFGTSNVPCLWGLTAAIQFANQIGLDRIEHRHRQLADYVLGEMVKRGADSWTSPDPALRCAIATVNVPPIQRMDIETWMWKNHKIRIRGTEPSKLRLCTAYYLQRLEIDHFLETFDQYKKQKQIA
jgi:selenocysteine lyase/cysteine desulfurase